MKRPPKVSFDQLEAELDGRPYKPWGEGVRAFKARCPAHDDKNPSLVAQELPDGTTRVKCWTGCQDYEIASALGYKWFDFKAMPPPEDEPMPKNPGEKIGFLMLQKSRRNAGQTIDDKTRSLEKRYVKDLTRIGQLPEWYL